MDEKDYRENDVNKYLGIEPNKAYASFLTKIFLKVSEAILIVKSPKNNPDQSEISFANPAFLKLTGFQEHEILHKNPFDVLKPLDKDKRPVSLSIAAIETEELSLHFHKNNGEPFLAQLTGYSITDASRDYHFQVQTYKELTFEILLMESQQKYKSLFDNHPDGVFALGLDGKFSSVNLAFEELTGQSRNELMHSTLSSLLPSSEKQLIQEALDRTKSGHTSTVEVALNSKDGSHKTLCITTLPIHVGSSITGIYGIAQDITQTKIQSSILKLEKRVLENIVGGQALEPTLDLFLREIESLHPSLMLTIMLTNSKETHLEFFAGSSLPPSFASQLKEVPIEEGAGACGTSAFFRKATAISNVQEHPYMKNYFDLAKVHDINACWSYPIFSSKGKLIGTFAIYKQTEGYPDQDVERIIERAGNIISILIENKQNEQNYKQLNERFKLAMDVSNEAIWDRDIKNNTLQWGSGFEIIFGYPIQEIEVSFNWWSFNLHPEDKNRVIKSLEKAIASKDTYWTDEYRYKAADGEFRYVLDRGHIIRDNKMKATRMVGAMIDLTERKSAEETIRSSEEQFRSLADATLEGIVITKNDKILDFNKAFSLMVGLEKEGEKIIGQSIFNFISDNNLSEIKKSLDLKNEGFYEGAHIRSQDQQIPVEIRAARSVYKGETATTISFRDISERRKAEQALMNYAAELARSNAELEQFAYMASHDLQEPLRMVTSFLQLLRDKYESQFDETGEQYIAYAIDGAERMKTLIKDLLKYSRISFHEEEKELIDLNDLLAEITSVFAIKFISEGGSLEIDDLPEVVGQRTLFSQLFQNLIGNGLKYRDKKAPVVRVSVLDRGSEWEFIVADNGIGIDEKFHDKIFVIFQRLHSRDEFSGTGIGLAICKKIVEKYGGTIWVESKPGEGSEFHFTLAKS